VPPGETTNASNATVSDDSGGGRGVQPTDERIDSASPRMRTASGNGHDDEDDVPVAPRGQRRLPPPPLGMLVDDARAGCPVAFERIYRLLAGQVASYLRWHRATDPDGLTNDVFVQVHRNLPTFEGDGTRFRSWLFTIAHHRMIDDRRRANRQPRVQGEVADDGVGCGDVEEDAFVVLSHDEVRSLVAVLSPEQRDVVLLRVVADLSVEQVARLLGKREGAVKALQHRALAALRRHLAQRSVRDETRSDRVLP
jgi:RNA polymerase sigma factor (sigma-70 family)